MSKVILNHSNGGSLVEILPENHLHQNGLIHIGGTMGALVTVTTNWGNVATNTPTSITFIGRGTIEVQNNHNLTVVNAHAPIGTLEATAGSIDYCNSYVYDALGSASIFVGTASQVNITGTDVPIRDLTLFGNSKLKFTHKGHNYSIHTPIDIMTYQANGAQIQNLDKLVTICAFINNKWVADTDFALEEICYLRDYQALNKTLVSLFMNQNGMISSKAVDNFINEHYFEFTAISHDANLSGSILPGAGRYNITEEISSWLNLDDVKLVGNDAGQVDNADQ